MNEPRPFSLISYNPETKTEQALSLNPESLSSIDSEKSQVQAKVNNHYLNVTLPMSGSPLFFVVTYKVLRFVGFSWLILTPLLGGTLLLFPIFDLNPPVSQESFWLILAVNLYWLYFFLKRSQPPKAVGLDLGSDPNIIQTFSNQSISLIQSTRLKTNQPNHLDLFLTSLEHPRVKMIVNRLGIDQKEFRSLRHASSKTPLAKHLPASLSACLYLAYEEAAHLNERFVEPEDLFLASLKIPGNHLEVFKKHELSFESIEKCVSWVVEELNKKSVQSLLNNFLSPVGGLNRDWTGTITPELDTSGIDFTRLAQKGLLPDIVGRDEEITKIAELLQSSKNNVLLVGPAGSGKTAIVEGLAKKVVFGEIQSNLKYKRIVSLDVASLVGGTKTTGEIGSKITKIVKDLQYGNVVLFLDDLEIVSSTKLDQGETSLLALLERSLAYGKLQVIASTTPEGYKRHIETQPNIARLFQTVTIKEASEKECLAILLSYVPVLERKNKIFITYPAVEQAVKLSNQYLKNKVQPDIALEVLEQTTISVSKTNTKVVLKDHVEKTITGLTQIPLAPSSKEETSVLLNLEKKLHERVVGQEEAITAVSDAMRRLRAGLKNGTRPIATFLFLGPTGVGKTELAKTLCNEYFGSEKRMVRLDMSEYETEESISGLIGPPPGQEGFESGGQLTQAVKNQPFSLILLDEIEKANPKIINLFLSLIDEGRLSDSSGEEVDFTNTIVIATSNAGSDLIKSEVEKNTPIQRIQSDVINEISKYFKPEFLNRFDGIIVYKPLSVNEVMKIAIIFLDELSSHLKEKQITFRFGPELVDQLASLGYDPKFGARPLRRVIQEKVENYLAKQILAGKIKSGDTVNLAKLPD